MDHQARLGKSQVQKEQKEAALYTRTFVPRDMGGNFRVSESGLGFNSNKLKICKMRVVGGWECTQGRQHKYSPFSSRGLLWY